MPRPDAPRLPRRRFLKTIGLAGLSSTVLPPLAMAQTRPTPAPAESTKVAPPKEEKPPEIAEDARTLAGII